MRAHPPSPVLIRYVGAAGRRREARPTGRLGWFQRYGEILDVLADPAHPGHADPPERVAGITGTGEPYDPDFLDIDAANRARETRFKAA